MVTLDTTRADHLGAYGHAGTTSPRIDRLARQATLFTMAQAQASVTPVSHASLLTGLNPYNHGLRFMHGPLANRLAPERTTLAEVLAGAGYETAAFVSAFPVSQRFGLHQGFQTFDAEFMRDVSQAVSQQGAVNTGDNQRRADETTDRALAWLGRAGEPFFLWLHYFDPHDRRLAPPEEFLARFGEPPADKRDALRALYDIEIAWMDHHLGRLLDRLRQERRLDPMLVVVTGDHGEGLGDHDWWTHGILYQEQVRLPLIIKQPHQRDARRVEHLVRSIDLMPTLLELAGVERARWPAMDGQSLVPLLRDGAPDPGLDAYADSLNTLSYRFAPGVTDRKQELYSSLVRGGWKYIHHWKQPDSSELYYLPDDPGERRNLWAAEPRKVRELEAALSQHEEPGRVRLEQGEMSEEDRERLRSLGYVE
jgi:arylsulfatase A-like enzyme